MKCSHLCGGAQEEELVVKLWYVPELNVSRTEHYQHLYHFRICMNFQACHRFQEPKMWLNLENKVKKKSIEENCKDSKGQPGADDIEN